GRPAEQLPLEAERLAGPPPETEVVLMRPDLAVRELEAGGDLVVDAAAGAAEGVPGLPRGAADLVVRLDAAPLQLEVLAALAQHLPHGAGPEAAQVLENGVREADVGGVASRHARGVALLESLVERLDQLGMRMHGSLSSVVNRSSDVRLSASLAETREVPGRFHPPWVGLYRMLGGQRQRPGPPAARIGAVETCTTKKLRRSDVEPGSHGSPATGKSAQAGGTREVGEARGAAGAEEDGPKGRRRSDERPHDRLGRRGP